MQELRELDPGEIDEVGGGILQVLAAAVVVYTAADIAYEFGRGFRDGLNG